MLQFNTGGGGREGGVREKQMFGTDLWQMGQDLCRKMYLKSSGVVARLGPG